MARTEQTLTEDSEIRASYQLTERHYRIQLQLPDESDEASWRNNCLYYFYRCLA